jgi:glycosyl hydrolase family 113
MDRFQRNSDRLEDQPMRRTRTFVAHVSLAAAALALGVAACASASAGVAPASGAAAIQQPQKSAPKPLVGVNLYVNRKYTLAQTKNLGARDLKYIARDLKLKAVSLAWDYNVPSGTSDVVNDSPTRTPTIADLAALTTIARSYGLRVEYRVLYAVGDSDSRGKSIRPKNLSAWLRSLLAAETPALRLAQRDHVSEFIAGTEMAAIDQSPLWGGFYAKAARIYHGILSYASWGGGAGPGGFFSPRRVLLPLKYFGASAYPPIDLPPTASVAQLKKAWLAFLRKAPESLLHVTALDELGIPEVAGAYKDPYQWDGLEGATPDPAIQANWYKAACEAADLVRVRAVYFWSAVLSSNPAGARPSLEGFEGHPATEAAIRTCS